MSIKSTLSLKRTSFNSCRAAIIILGIILCNTCFAQSKYMADGFWVENYTKKQGLPENIIINIMQDKKGYIWLTTPYKLVRFDGYGFKIFNPRDQYPDLYIHFYPGLIEDADGMFWMVAYQKGS